MTTPITQAATGHFWTNEGSCVNRLNDRVLVGAATVNSGNIPTTVKDWLETAVPATTTNAQMAVISTIGQIGIVGASRTSDFPYVSAGCIGVSGYAFNDLASHASTAYAGYFESHATVTSGISAATICTEMDICNATGHVVPMTPYDMFPVNQTINLWLGSGAAAGAVDASVAIGILNNGAKYDKGIVFHSNSIRGCDGTTGSGTAVALAKGHNLVWFTPTGQVGSYLGSQVSDYTKLTSAQFTDLGFQVFNDNGDALLTVAHVANAVNGIQLKGSATGSAVEIGAIGLDNTLDISLVPKNGYVCFGNYAPQSDQPITGCIYIKDGSGAVRQLATIN